MRPFIEGLCELYDARLVYRTFTSGGELRRLLSDEAIDHSQGRVIVYVASHGWGGRLDPGREGPLANLAPIAHDMHSGVECVWLGACDLGGSKALSRFLDRSGAVLAGGYLCAVDWDASLLLDLSVLQELLKSRSITSRRRAVTVLKSALQGFTPSWVVGVNVRDDDVALRKALRVMARNRVRGAGSRPKDITHELITALKWRDVGPRTVNERVSTMPFGAR
jgi:hypothetical protein